VRFSAGSVCGGSTSLFFWRFVRLGETDVDAAHGAFFEAVNALLWGLIGHISVVYYFGIILTRIFK
jgi:hypothetical protein